MSEAPRIRIVAAVVRDGAGRTLLVRKRRAAVFQQPGGKRDPVDADDLATDESRTTKTPPAPGVESERAAYGPSAATSAITRSEADVRRRLAGCLNP